MAWTKDELRVAREMVAEGYTYREIGQRLGRSEKNVAEYLRRRKKGKTRKYTRVVGAQLCWDCRKATGGGDCEWANSKCRQTVPGWTAAQVEPRAGYNAPGAWYFITACPKFEKG